jgi:predicted transcriptional regulator
MTRRKKKLEPMSIRLDPDVKAALQGFAEEEERSLSFYVNRVLRDYVEQIEARKQEAQHTEAKKQETKKRPPERL